MATVVREKETRCSRVLSFKRVSYAWLIFLLLCGSMVSNLLLIMTASLTNRQYEYDRLLPPRNISQDGYAGGRDRPPIVLEKYKLIFFPTAKVATTTFYFLFRRIMGFENWYYVTPELPHTMGKNGLVYLTDYSLETAEAMMKSPNWTRAIFVRDPKERLVSAYLNKAIRKYHKYFYPRKCKKRNISNRTCLGFVSSFEEFFDFVTSTDDLRQDEHWIPQWDRMQPEYWPYINFIGDFETLAEDSRRLLEKLGLWEQYGAYGWGNEITEFHNETSKNESLFGEATKPHHATDARALLEEHFSSASFEERVEEFYKMDYTNDCYSDHFKKPRTSFVVDKINEDGE